jgi:hypothetical protein
VLSPLRFSFEPNHQVAVIEVKYLDSPRLVVEALTRLLEEPTFQRALNLCVEYKSLRQVPTLTRLRELTARLHRLGFDKFHGKCALVAWTPEARDAARNFASLLGASVQRVRVFSDCDEALHWFQSAGSPLQHLAIE